MIYKLVKRAADILISLILVVVLCPVMLIVPIIIKADSPGPVIHARRCLKKDGTFRMLKFRSMVEDAYDYDKHLSSQQKEIYGKEIKLDDDPRVTKAGRVLRRLSIDELPQLFNVLAGDMSLVGPRPVATEEAGLYGDSIQKILSVKPGITGYWQTHGRSEVTYSSGRRQEMELYYVDHCGLLLDTAILFRTVLVVFGQKGVK
ncbi:MAG: sugar transferase [Lachnospiraceae bacterium]|nr:sugar transferase [Lachnospiraceae bacterium]